MLKSHKLIEAEKCSFFCPAPNTTRDLLVVLASLCLASERSSELYYILAVCFSLSVSWYKQPLGQRNFGISNDMCHSTSTIPSLPETWTILKPFIRSACVMSTCRAEQPYPWLSTIPQVQLPFCRCGITREEKMKTLGEKVGRQLVRWPLRSNLHILYRGPVASSNKLG